MTSNRLATLPLGPDRSGALIEAIGAFASTASFEMAAKDTAGLIEARDIIPAGTMISVTWMPNDTHDERVAAASAIRDAGFVPLPHIAARRIRDGLEFAELVKRLNGEAGVDQLFIIGGDLAQPSGEFQSSLELIARQSPARLGIRAIGVAGYPEGHPTISQSMLEQELDTKLAIIADGDMTGFAISQFAFAAEPIVQWLRAFRARGNQELVRIGLAGPANLRTLLRYGRLCGAGASMRVLSNHGASIARILTETGPDPVIQTLVKQTSVESLGAVALHLFPFGGLARTARWVVPVRERRIRFHNYQFGFEPLSPA